MDKPNSLIAYDIEQIASLAVHNVENPYLVPYWNSKSLASVPLVSVLPGEPNVDEQLSVFAGRNPNVSTLYI